MSKDSAIQKTFDRLAAWSMVFVCAISLLAIFGWLIDQPILASLSPEFIPMAPSTALLFLGCCGLWLIHRLFSARRGFWILGQAGLVGILLIVILLTIRYFTGLGPDFEQILVPNPGFFGEFERARISPLTGFGFFLTFVPLLLLTRREPGPKPKTVSAVLSLIVSIFSGLIILGYLYNVPLFYGGTFIPVAVTTALSFLFLSLGLLLTAGPDCWPARQYVGPSLQARMMRAFLPATTAIVLFQGFFSTVSAPWIVNPAIRVALAALLAAGIVYLIVSFLAKNISKEIERGDRARMDAENALNQSEARFRTLIETASDAIINIDHAGQIVLWNRAAEKIFGYSAVEALSKPLEIIIPEESFPVHQQGLERLVSTGESHFIGKTVEITGLKKDGSKFPLALSLASWQVGEDVYFSGIGRDISERKQAEEALRAASNRQQDLLSAVPDIIMEMDNNLVYTWANQPGLKFFGEDVIGREAAFYFEGEQDKHELVNLLLEDFENTIYVENWHRRRDGQKRLLAWWRHELKGEIGNVTGSLSTARDITEQWQVENALNDERRLLVTLMDTITDMIYFKDAESRFIRVNLAQVRRFGLDNPAQIIGKTDFDLFGEEHAQAAYADEQAIIGSGLPLVAKEEKETFLDGHASWVSTIKMPLRGQQGQIVGTFGISRDITASKLAEDALRKSESFLQAVLHSTAEGILAVNNNNEVLYASERFAEIWRIPQEVMSSKDDPVLLQYVLEQLCDPQSFLKKVQELYQSNDESFDTLNFKDGRVFERFSRPLMQGENVLGRVWSFRDITERKQFEEELQFRNTILSTQQEASIDGILVVDENVRIVLYNHRYVEMWGIPPGLIEQKANEPVLEFVADKVTDRETFFSRVQYLYDHKQETSRDEIGLKNGLIFDRYSAPMIGPDNRYYGRVWYFRDITERKRLENEILNLSLTDELTGLYNRRGFTLLAEQEVKLAHRMKRTMLLFFGDVDNLKTINDTWGHARGDQALQDISATLKENFRESDIVARFGGDEFVVLAVDASMDNAEMLINRIQSALETHSQQDAGSYHLSLSLGYAFYDPEVPCTVSELISSADHLMYQQKQARKDKK